MTPADTRSTILAEASRHLDRLARQVDHEWPTLRYRMTQHPRAVAHGRGTPPPGFTLDEGSARAQAIGDAAMSYATAAARQRALPYYLHADERAEVRRECNSFTQATRLGPMTDWHQHRGQSADARIRAGLIRAQHFARAIPGVARDHGTAWQSCYLAAVRAAT